MQLTVLFSLCWTILAALEATAGDAQKATDKPFLPRYTLLAESKKQDLDLERQQSDVTAAEQQPWRRLAYSAFGGHQTGWPASTAGISLGPLLGPGLMLLGVNLGALLYMLLGMLGLAPPHRIGAWHAGDIYRNDRQHVDAGKETALYF